jgi:TnpA family transposase
MHPGSRTSNASGFTPSRADGSGIAHKSKSPRLAISTLEDNWDDILRFIATIKLKETTVSEIFRRLNSYSKRLFEKSWQSPGE